MISNAFACRNVGPAGEARVAALMADAVGRERKRQIGLTSGYSPGKFTGGAYDDARAVVLRVLAGGACESREILPHVGIGRNRLALLLGAMRSEGLVAVDGRSGSGAYVWRVASG